MAGWFKFLLLIKIIFIIKFCNSTKWWLDSTPDLKKSQNWEANSPPCDFDQIIFPEKYSGGIITPKNLEIDSLILPVDGALIFGEQSNVDSTITFTNGADKNKISKGQKCNRNNLAKLKPSSQTNDWFDPNNWTPDGEFNLATPHIERIPCANEKAMIVSKGVISINMENIEKLELGGFNMGGIDMSYDKVEKDFFSDLAHVIFEKADDIQVRFLDSNTCGCHRPEMIVDYEKVVCSHVLKDCEEKYPQCLDPILPVGHCCKICGSLAKLELEDCMSFNLKRFKELVEKEITEQGLKNQLIFYASIINDGKIKYVQLIVTDKYDYNEKSADFMKIFNKSILQEAYSSLPQSFQLSGMRYDKNHPGSAWKYVYAPFFVILAFFMILYVYFEPENSYIRLPPWLYPSRYGSPFVFARFDNNQGEMEVAENLTVTPEQGIRSRDAPRSFDNPMFEEKLDEPKVQNLEESSTDVTELIEIELEGIE